MDLSNTPYRPAARRRKGDWGLLTFWDWASIALALVVVVTWWTLCWVATERLAKGQSWWVQVILLFALVGWPGAFQASRKR